MKIGTLSLNINTDDLNYGAVLHSWAFVKALEKYGFSDNAEVIDYVTPKFENFDGHKPVTSYLKMKRYKTALKVLICHGNYLKRFGKFRKFIGRHMKVSGESYTQKKLWASSLNYDCLICESDVIWSADFFRQGLDPTFFLDFKSAEDKRKIIYAASMANGKFSEADKAAFKELIKAPDCISCRESYAADITRQCGREDAVSTIDPVLLLSAEDYRGITARSRFKKPYLLLYIPLDYNGVYQKTAEAYAKKHGLEVVELSYYVWNGFRHKVIADAGIEEFLSLIKNADTVFTNSFHAVCFSCIFHKQFYAFERGTGRKTEDFCRLMGLEERYVNVNGFKEAEAVDFKAVDEKLARLREDSLKWLGAAIGKNDNE